jgi:hypothetical protein
MNIEPYRQYKEAALRAYREGNASSLSLIASVNFVPIYALVLFCLEEYPNDELLLKRKKSIEEFYGYEF